MKSDTEQVNKFHLQGSLLLALRKKLRNSSKIVTKITLMLPPKLYGTLISETGHTDAVLCSMNHGRQGEKNGNRTKTIFTY